MFSDLAVTTLGGYDPSNETHVRMAEEAKRVGVIPVWRPTKYYAGALLSYTYEISFGYQEPVVSG